MSKPGYDIQRIKVRSDGYDAAGAYWGTGPDVFIATSPDGDDTITVRARDAAEARRKIAAELSREPGAPPSEPRDPLGGNPPRKTRYHFDWTNPADGNVIRIRVTHARDYLASGTDHLETESLSPAKAPLPITQTGYLSHFILPLELKSAGGPVAFIKAWLDREAAGPSWTKAAALIAQGELFTWSQAQTEIMPKSRPSGTRSKTTKPSPPASQRDGKASRRRANKREP